ncbi:hypothetical protein [Rhodopila sp.]|uniref:hypothetical protein n=1 Tax=Rhodopila sp. TaxID=2480087 RepID=UPI003D128780
MPIPRRGFIKGVTASLPLAAGLRATSSAAAEFRLNDLASPSKMWAELLRVNDEFGPTRLCGQPHHRRYVAYLRRQLTDILEPVGGRVFEDTFDNYPNWAATSWGLSAAGQEIPVASYFPYCTGGFTGARLPLVPATALAASGVGGGYPRADGVNVKIIPPTTSGTASVINLGTFAGTGSINWADASGKIAYVDYPVTLGSSFVTPAIYNVNETYDSGQVNQESLSIAANPTYSIQDPPDISNATNAGVLGVILGWVGISDGNAAGQYAPFEAPFSSYPQGSQKGSDPAATTGGIPALWVTEGTGTWVKDNLAGQNTEVTIALEATINQVATSTVWGILPGANYGSADDQFLVCNTHSDGPNIAEENGGIALLHVARYFARIPQSQRPRSIAFMVATGHFSHLYLGSSGDWIAQHPQIISNTVASLTIEHFGCNEWEDVETDSGLEYAATGKLEQARCYVTQPSFQLDQPGPADPALLSIVDQSLVGLLDRAAVLSGGAFSGEGGPFHRAKIPAIGYIPVPQYLVAIADDGEISKLDPEHFYDQVEFTIKCLLALQDTSAALLAG